MSFYVDYQTQEISEAKTAEPDDVPDYDAEADYPETWDDYDGYYTDEYKANEDSDAAYDRWRETH
jgi:hypothetical protein